MKITARKLERLSACGPQVDLFREHFPNGCTVSKRLCIKYANTFDFEWCGYFLLERFSARHFFIESLRGMEERRSIEAREKIALLFYEAVKREER